MCVRRTVGPFDACMSVDVCACVLCVLMCMRMCVYDCWCVWCVYEC